MVIEGWRLHRALGRTLLVGFFLWMCGAAVYLDHHWVIDIVLGWAYAIATAFAIRQVDRWRRQRSPVRDAIAPESAEVEPGHG
jgi:membrane-associated phospholipid phosphatase